jgi:hypothetical protein
MNIQHQNFLQRLSDSRDAVFAVARWLSRHGEDVEIPATRFAPSPEVADDFVDAGDVFATRNGRRRLIEVKGSRHFFISHWPFADHFFLAKAAAVERRKGLVAAYVIVAAGLRHAAYVRGDTAERWYLHEAKASNTGNIERVYACSPTLATFVDLDR